MIIFIIVKCGLFCTFLRETGYNALLIKYNAFFFPPISSDVSCQLFLDFREQLPNADLYWAKTQSQNSPFLNMRLIHTLRT